MYSADSKFKCLHNVNKLSVPDQVCAWGSSLRDVVVKGITDISAGWRYEAVQDVGGRRPVLIFPEVVVFS